MATPRRLIIIISSITLILVIALSLATAIEIRTPPEKIVQISVAQAAKEVQFENELKGKARINETGFDRGEIYSGSSEVVKGTPTTLYISVTKAPAVTNTDEGMIGQTPTPQPTPSSVDEGFIGPSPTASPRPVPQPPPGPQFPILALSYDGDGGPKHCRGDLLQKMSFPPPASDWKNGTCVNLPSDARCGVFFAGKDDNCEAQLFNMANCYNTTETFVNTVVFMPEERAVGALWRSMYIRCGVEAPEAGLLDPSILGGLLKKPGSGG